MYRDIERHADAMPALVGRDPFGKIERARAGSTTVLNYEVRLRMPNGSVKYVRTIAHGNRGMDGPNFSARSRT
jgi:hypothetical protein